MGVEEDIKEIKRDLKYILDYLEDKTITKSDLIALREAEEEHKAGKTVRLVSNKD